MQTATVICEAWWAVAHVFARLVKARSLGTDDRMNERNGMGWDGMGWDGIG